VDPVKVVIFVVAFLLLLFLGRKLSSRAELQMAIPPPPQPPTPETIATHYSDEDEAGENLPAAVGADIPFPVSLPPVRRNPDGRFNRPNFLNYHFRTIDLKAGPEDPTCFCDELFVQTRDPDDGHFWTNKFTVATPSGMERLMNDERLVSLYLDSGTIVVLRWDLETIIGTVVQEIMKAYLDPNDPDRAAQDQLN
jgi:hypothetical protein